MEVVYYPPNINAFAARNIHTWARQNGCDYVIELHRNAGGGDGSEVLLMLPAAPEDNISLNVIANYIPKNRGLKDGSWLQNASLMNIVSISYCLLEVGFIDNPGDNAEFDKNLALINTDLYNQLKNIGIKKLGVVYGHGGTDPGACAYNRTEAIDVRKIILNSKGENIMPTFPYPKSIIQELWDTRENRTDPKQKKGFLKIEMLSDVACHKNRFFWEQPTAAKLDPVKKGEQVIVPYPAEIVRVGDKLHCIQQAYRYKDNDLEVVWIRTDRLLDDIAEYKVIDSNDHLSAFINVSNEDLLEENKKLKEELKKYQELKKIEVYM